MAEGLDEGRYGRGVPLSPNHHPTAPSNVTTSYRSHIPAQQSTESWTPFSGMPSSPVSTTGIFPWETLNTSTPTNAFSNQQLPSLFTSDYPYGLSNVLSSASDDSGYIQNENMSNSSPSAVGSPIQRPMYPSQPMSGPESLELYAEAIKQYQEEVAAMQYNQFPTNPPSPDLSSHPSTPQPTMIQEPTMVHEKKEPGKPTYSDMAKSLKNKPMHKDGEIPKSKSPTEGLGKTQRQQSKRSGASKGHSSRSQLNDTDGNFGNVVSPDSKYGLDQFEDIDSGSRSDRSSILGGSNESLSYRSRQGSTSSLSSGTSGGIEDVHFPKTFNIQTVKENDVCPEFERKEEQKKEPEIEKKSASTQKEKPGKFFDPRRIFASKETNKKKADIKEKPRADTILNNGKPMTKPHSAAHKKADYINNDLRDPRKRTNQNTASSQEEKKVFSEPVTQNGAQMEKNKPHGTQKKETPNGRSMKKSSPNLDWEAIDEYVNNIAEKFKNGVKYILSLLVTVLVYIFGVFMYIVFWCVHIIGVVGVKVWNWCSLKFFSNKFTYKQTGVDNVKRKIGLEENIVLPTTGEEAMKRLLSCKGKDPYSILGLRADVTDEEVKKYYRKQAILVHPDKNKELGAEESFKILGHAFEMIGEPTKRLQFDAKTKEESDAESAMKEFADLLTKLQEKIQEASNLMRCDNCNGKHKRTPINRPWYSARFCEKCNIRHSAKEGDVWAETTMLGFCWHYYAIMDGSVFDITEWVACHKDFFKHMQANAHPVLYRIATDGNRNHRNQGNQSREAELEDFINQLFNKANMSQDGGGVATSSPWQQQQQNKSQSSSSQWNAGSGGGKKSRKKKKRH